MPTHNRRKPRDHYKNKTPTGRPKRKYAAKVGFVRRIGVTVSLDPLALSELRQRAAAAGLNVSRYLTACFMPPPPAVEISEPTHSVKISDENTTT